MDLLFMNLDVLSLTSEIGHTQDGVYYADENCRENLVAIFDMLDNDDRVGSCRQQMGNAGIFESDLVPLMENIIDDDELFDPLIRVMTGLTDPLVGIDEASTRINRYNKSVIDCLLLNYKRSFHRAILWVHLTNKIISYLRRESRKNSPDLTGLSLNFVRNIVSIEDNEQGHRIVTCYADSGMARLIQYITATNELEAWHLHGTEIFSGLLGDTEAKQVTKINTQFDSLKHSTFIEPCKKLEECQIEYTPAMQDRVKMTTKTSKLIFLHYYTKAISMYSAETILSSLAAKVSSISGKYKIAVSHMSIWLLNFVISFEVEQLERGEQLQQIWHRIMKLFSIGLRLAVTYIGDSKNNILMETLARRSIKMLELISEISKKFKGHFYKITDQELLGEFEEISENFIKNKMETQLNCEKYLDNKFVFAFFGTIIDAFRGQVGP
jgi:hypothetical protein